MKMDKIKEGCFWIAVLLLVIPFAANIMYTLPSADDISMLCGYDYSANIFVEAIRQANNTWLSWGGQWFYVIVLFLFEPLLIVKNPSFMSGAIMIMKFVFFIILVLVDIRLILKKIFRCKSHAVLRMVQLLVLVMILNTGVYPEIYTWYNGGTYLTAMNCMLLCIVIMIVFYENQSVKQGILLAVVGFFTCMSPVVVCLVCCVYLIMFFVSVVKEKLRKSTLIPLLFCLGGGIVFALSPGNFKRQAGVDSTGIHIGEAIKNALFVEGIFGYALLRNVLIGILFIGIAVLSYVYARKCKGDLKFVNPLKTVCWFIMIMFCVIFPVTLGYSSTDMPNRIQYIINTYMVFGLSICAVNFGFWLGSKYMETLDAKSVRMLCFVMMIAIYLGPLSKDVLGTTPYVRQIKGHADVVACHDDWIDILNEIASSQDKDVVIKRDKIATSDIIKTPELSQNPEKWINVGTAGYFGKDSVSVIVNDN